MKLGDSIEPQAGLRIILPVENNWAGDYRLEYDGKYITLFGRDKNYPGFNFGENTDVWYEEMVLVPVVLEVRNANPVIIESNEKFIQIDLGCSVAPDSPYPLYDFSDGWKKLEQAEINYLNNTIMDTETTQKMLAKAREWQYPKVQVNDRSHVTETYSDNALHMLTYVRHKNDAGVYVFTPVFSFQSIPRESTFDKVAELQKFHEGVFLLLQSGMKGIPQTRFSEYRNENINYPVWPPDDNQSEAVYEPINFEEYFPFNDKV